MNKMTQIEFIKKMNEIAKKSFQADHCNFIFNSIKNCYELELSKMNEKLDVFPYEFNFEQIGKSWSIKDFDNSLHKNLKGYKKNEI